jgi:hypothetical protein
MFYVYAHIDPRLSVLFYVGKGQGKRAYEFNYRNNFYKNFLRKMRDEGFEPIVEFLHVELTEEQAHCLEIQEINKYGRRDNGTGCLLNLTDGGEGRGFGFRHSAEVRKKLGNGKRGKPLSEKHKEAMRQSRLKRGLKS